MTKPLNNVFSHAALSIGESITHGMRMRIAQLNEGYAEPDKIIDLSIGTLDTPTDLRIDQGVIDFIKNTPHLIHQFAPVKGFDFLLKAIAQRVARVHDVTYDPATEIMVTPGGIKGAIAVVLHSLLNSGDEVIVPLPNWPHYADMIRLHGGTPVFVQSDALIEKGVSANALSDAITPNTKLIILGDCINPTGKVYTTSELQALGAVVAKHNIDRAEDGLAPMIVIYDCPYEAHILNERAKAFAALTVGAYRMRDCVVNVTGPGKTYGMHGDRIGYMYAPDWFIAVAANVQVNLNSFAGTYGQVACFHAMEEAMDEVAHRRATQARNCALEMIALLRACQLSVHTPQGGYFIFADLSTYAKRYQQLGYTHAEQFLLQEARVATISGEHFAEGYAGKDHYRHFVRINCGRDSAVLTRAAQRIKIALDGLR
ncbi:pyridoxal phosphate-dependent aminotransferase [Undibacterium sp. RTI2.1]|uniref:pyridoxal phosphate-dependent aminotransferase n=1 Tax=unclassified Undibacterium TaxID=2630295 RepID=UPI002AB3C718|nr:MULTISPECIES: pyridoxal phosphate-dependent aminotransferase [unclassified Undibacterium]MDY7540720.1 pyridoxal phosphate-dependent aminotransferase [Undibacterium sp. 5I1]MEB0033147.1 pyridoxal phosphate-dependent aminotransferase [Undibacterium sp. RTI2.1]MEB0118946.1 pyridoxal phosphate-dependent aminotransferase [Undibacterium sp. RTI2.2]MEB0233175.1 pyridoxal phosphate-dependent aminotransferase [Undibacterium sp. 10I3]MEB0259856.1 pyridoxal phosphate-dependent aminotransferase [Undiba